MAPQSVLLGSLTLRIKGNHAYRLGVKVGDHLFCTIEPENRHSGNAVVYSKIVKRRYCWLCSRNTCQKIIKLCEESTDGNYG